MGVTVFKAGGREVRLKFRYVESPLRLSNDTYLLRVTEAHVWWGEEAKVEGRAFCSPRDKFCYATGRRVALTRALSRWPRSRRREFWTGLFATRDHPKLVRERAWV